jgi:predicted nucleic acid-binding protein
VIFLDTNVVSETLRKSPDESVVAWLVRHNAEIALPTVTIAKSPLAFRKSDRMSGLPDFIKD